MIAPGVDPEDIGLRSLEGTEVPAPVKDLTIIELEAKVVDLEQRLDSYMKPGKAKGV